MWSFDFEVIALVALMAAFIVLLVKKWGWAEWMQIHGDKYLSKLFSCDLCMSFWAGLFISFAFVMWYDDPIYMIMPVFTTPLTRMLV